MSPITLWKSPPSALHSFSITDSIFLDNWVTGQSDGQAGQLLNLRVERKPRALWIKILGYLNTNNFALVNYSPNEWKRAWLDAETNKNPLQPIYRLVRLSQKLSDKRWDWEKNSRWRDLKPNRFSTPGPWFSKWHNSRNVLFLYNMYRYRSDSLWIFNVNNKMIYSSTFQQQLRLRSSMYYNAISAGRVWRLCEDLNSNILLASSLLSPRLLLKAHWRRR